MVSGSPLCGVASTSRTQSATMKRVANASTSTATESAAPPTSAPDIGASKSSQAVTPMPESRMVVP